MQSPDDESELDKTKMSFGEHLEELRRALFKSIAALLVGTAIGLLFGNAVVDYIQTPLRGALDTYYRGQAEAKVLERLEESRDAGATVPDDLQAAAKAYADAGFVPYDVFIDPDELRRAIEADANGELPDGPTSALPASPDELVRLRTFRPLDEDPRLHTVGLNAQEPFMVYLKASIVVGAVIASPPIFYFIWEFVAAGLYRNERRYVYVFLPMSLGLFFAGAALAFFVVFKYVLDFLFWFNQQMGIDPMPRISEWMSFVLMLPLGFGISFQLPLVMLFLERIGLMTVESYLRKWRIAVLVIAILSMFLTPADPGSMIAMGVPLVALYFGGIALCHYMPRDGARKTPVTDEKTAAP